MTINKYFALTPNEEHQTQESEVVSEKEAQRQALVKKAQEQGGL